MGPLEARAVLLQHLQWESDSVPSHIQLYCDSIAKRLGYLALAIGLAGAYIKNEDDQQTALAQYLVDYGKHQDELLQRDHFRGLSEATKTVWTVWDKTLDRIRDLEPKARPNLLLAFFARFRGNIIQDELFRLASLGLPSLKAYFAGAHFLLPAWIEAWTELDQSQWDSFHYRTTRDLLIRYGLLQRENGEWPAVTMHSLVQWRAMKYEKDRPWDIWHLIFITAVFLHSNENSGESRFRRNIIPQILEVSALKMAAPEFDESQRSFIDATIGHFFFHEERDKEAERLIVPVIETRNRILGEEHKDTWNSVSDLIYIHQNQGRYKEAELLAVRLLEYQKRVLGEEHPNTLDTMFTLVLICGNPGRRKEGDQLAVQLLKTQKRVLGEEHPSTLISMSYLAVRYSEQGRWKEAEELRIQVLNLQKRILGEEHPATLTSMNNLASTYWSQGRWTEAEELHIQVLNLEERILGKEHPATLMSMSNLAMIYWSQGRWKRAEELQIQALEIKKRVLGEEHPGTLTSMFNLAYVFKSQSRGKEAISLMTTCWKLRNQILGPTHPQTEHALEILNEWEDEEGAHSEDSN